ATRFAGGDRWKALVTCPRERMLFWDVVVRGAEGGDVSVSFPLAPAAPLACGNHVALPGAFRIDGGGPVQVCLVLSEDPVDRAATGAAAACKTLVPEGR